jgi:hypothetical protein
MNPITPNLLNNCFYDTSAAGYLLAFSFQDSWTSDYNNFYAPNGSIAILAGQGYSTLAESSGSNR